MKNEPEDAACNSHDNRFYYVYREGGMQLVGCVLESQLRYISEDLLSSTTPKE